MIYIREDRETYELGSEPLSNRVWTLQEMLLSPRILVFDSYQVTMKCHTDKFKPVFPSCMFGEPSFGQLPGSVFGVPGENQTLTNIPRDLHKDNMQVFQEDLSHFWWLLVGEYSERDLTRLEDRLAALAGAVEELLIQRGDTYLAGFWKESLLNHHLGWRITETWNTGKERFRGVDKKKRIGTPSCSWSTVPRRVYYRKLTIPKSKSSIAKWSRHRILCLLVK